MQESETDILFPPRIIPSLRSLKGSAWQDLVDRIAEQDALTTDRLAFVLMMIRLNGCLSCQADSFKAMRGCTQCASQTIKRYRGSDQNLIRLFQESQQEVLEYYIKV